MNSLISVVVTCYNHAPFIQQCLESIFHQSYKNLELFVINDGSTDLSGNIIEGVIKNSPFKNTTYLAQENKGICVTRNQAFEFIRGEYILFVDSDNYLEPNYIEEMLKTAEEHGADIIYTSLRDPDSGNSVIDVQEFDLEKYFIGNYIDNCSLIRISKIGNQRYDLQLNRKKLVDYDFFLSLILNQGAIPFPCNKTHLNYRMLSDSISAHGDILKYSDAYSYLMLKHSVHEPHFAHQGLVIYMKSISESVWKKSQYLTIYTTEDGTFQDFKVKEFPLNNKGKEVIHISNEVKKIRLDFSELPIILKFIRVTVLSRDTALQPESTNGFVHGDEYIFDRYDPQLTYSLSAFDKDIEIEIDYEIELEAIKIVQRIGPLYQELANESQEKQILEQKNSLLQEQLEHLQLDYNRVTHSRRWTLSTKIINFFRRK